MPGRFCEGASFARPRPARRRFPAAPRSSGATRTRAPTSPPAPPAPAAAIPLRPPPLRDWGHGPAAAAEPREARDATMTSGASANERRGRPADSARAAPPAPHVRARAAPRRRWRWRAAAPAGEAASAATGLTEPARCFARPRGPGAAGAVSPGRLPAAPPPLPGSLLAGRRRGAAPRARTGWAARPGRVAGARRPRRRGGAGGTCGPFPFRWLLVDSVAALGDPLADSGLCPQSYGKLRHAP